MPFLEVKVSTPVSDDSIDAPFLIPSARRLAARIALKYGGAVERTLPAFGAPARRAADSAGSGRLRWRRFAPPASRAAPTNARWPMPTPGAGERLMEL